jgi:hypothetical protein
MQIEWTENGWRVTGFGVSFIAENYQEAFFFLKYEADIDADFMMDFILND